MQPNLLPTVEKHQLQQKSAHDNSKPLILFTKGETVLVHNKRGTQKWITGKILQQKGPVSYLVRVGSRVRYCHVDHLLKSNVLPDENPSIGHDSKRDTGSADFFMPIDNDVDAEAEPTITLVPRHSTRNRQPPRRLIEEMNN